MFRAALEVMGELYASPLGTCVLQAKEVPPRPPGLPDEEGAYNETPYDRRGWCRFEQAVTIEAASACSAFPKVQNALRLVTTPKFLRIDDPDDLALDRMPTAAPIEIQLEEDVAAAIEAAAFTGKGDRDVVMKLFDDYCQRLRSMTWRANRWVA